MTLIQNSIEELTSNTTDLRNSNQAISDSVQTISAVSEELTAHASETMDAETVNTQILENIAAKMKSLVQYIQNSKQLPYLYYSETAPISSLISLT